MIVVDIQSSIVLKEKAIYCDTNSSLQQRGVSETWHTYIDCMASPPCAFTGVQVPVCPADKM